MKKKGICRLMAILLCLIMVLSLAACGKSSKDTDDDDDRKTSSSSSKKDDDDGSDRSDKDDKNDIVSDNGPDNDGGGSSDGGKTASADKDMLTIYRVGSDLLAVRIKSDKAKEVMGVDMGGYTEQSKSNFNIVDDTWNYQLSLYTQHVNLSYPDASAENGWGWVSSHYETEPAVSEDEYFGFIYSEGICDKYKVNGELTVFLTGESDGEELAKFNTADVIKDITLEELADVAGQAYSHGEKLMCDWAGSWLTDEYDELKGYANIRVTEHGGILIDCKIGDDVCSYAAVEKIADYYGELTEDNYNARLMLLNFDYDYERTDYRLDISYSFYRSEYSESESLRYSKNYRDGGRYEDASMDRFVAWHTAGEDYKDEDVNGLIADASEWKDDIYKPKTDDYIIVVYPNATQYSGENSWPSVLSELYSYDINGRLIDHTQRYRFNSETDAKEYHDALVSYGYDEYVLSGRDIYYSYEVDYYLLLSVKYGAVSSASKWVVGGHYFPYFSYEDDLYSITYMSKPYTEENYSVSLEDAVYWQSIPRGSHRSLETRDATISMEVTPYYLSVYTYGNVDADGHSFVTGYSGPFGEPRFTGRKLVASTIYRTYEPGTYADKFYTVFTEVDFGDTECEVKQYYYPISDIFDTSVTFDNYSSKTAEYVLTQHYDMLRAD